MDLPVRQLESAPEGVYVHVPFCRRRCGYCDFYSTVLEPGRVGPFLDALDGEIARWADRVDLTAVRTLFIGGGTPTALPPDALERIIEAVRDAIGRSAGRGPVEEFTVEANPATVSPELAGRLRRLGVDRLSIGAQSFDAGDLAVLDRAHDPGETAESVRVARSAGFENISLDLIFAVPGQTARRWRANLSAAVELGVEHLSCYGLTIEPGTPLAAQVAGGRVVPAEEGPAAAMYRAAIGGLRSAGLEQYEISNFARSGRQCAHNLLYWRNRDWLGLGPAAASHLDGWRFRRPGDLERYVATGGRDDFEQVERLSGAAAVGEAAMLALRLREGLDANEFARRYGADPRMLWAEPIRRHADLGLLEWSDGRLRLTEAALPVADSVLADFLAAQPAPAVGP